MKRLFVTGTSRLFAYGRAKEVAEMVGFALAQADFGLVTGNASGVEAWTARSYCSTLGRLARDEKTCFQQMWRPWPNGRSWLPGSSYRSQSVTPVTKESDGELIEEALHISDAAIVIGGHRGTLKIVRRFMDRRKPVFPIPFTGGHSNEIFQDILKTWCDAPVENLTRNQFLSLALPWNSGSGTLENLLRGTLAEKADIFVSYRRNDVASGAGRLHHDLVEHFGSKRVFMDIFGIAPSQSWENTIQTRIGECKVGIIVIGKGWIETHADDVLHKEVRMLLEQNKDIAPVLIDGASLPERSQIPALDGLLRYQAQALNNSNWDLAVSALITQLDRAIAEASRSKPSNSA